MADIRDEQTDDIKKAYEGLYPFVNPNAAEGPNGMEGAPFNAFKPLIRILSRQIDQNDKPKSKANADGNLTADDLAKKQGLKDQLKGILDKAQTGTQLTPLEINAMESALYVGGQTVSFDGNLSNDQDAMVNFRTEYFNAPDTALLDVQQSAVQLANASDAMEATIAGTIKAAEDAKIAEAKAAEALQQSYNTRVDAILVYNGYLDPAKAGDGNARMWATHELILDHQYDLITADKDLNDLMTDIFNADGTVKEEAIGTNSPLEKALGFTNESMLPASFREHLESGDPKLVSLAENYMIAKGQTGITADGVLDQATATAAEKMLAAKVTVPSSIYYGDKINFGEITSQANHGQLLLPTDDQLSKYLGDDSLETIKHLKSYKDPSFSTGMTREEFIAMELIDSGTKPSKYQQFLDDYNTANIDPKLNAAIAQPVIETDNTNNPLDLAASGAGEQALTEYGIDTSNAAIAQTPDGTAIYEGDEGIYAFIDHLKRDGDTITMQDALLTQYYATQTVGEASMLPAQLAGMGGGSLLPTQGYADELERTVRNGGKSYSDAGFDPKTAAFDLNNPRDIQTLVTALSVHAQAEKGALDMSKGNNIVTAYLNDPKFAGDINSTTRVAEAGGIRPAGDDGIRTAQTEAAPKTDDAPIIDEDVEKFYANDGNEGRDPLAPQTLPTNSGINLLENAPMSKASLWPFPVTNETFKISLPEGTKTPVTESKSSFNTSGGLISLPEMIKPEMQISTPGMSQNYSPVDPNIFKPF